MGAKKLVGKNLRSLFRSLARLNTRVHAVGEADSKKTDDGHDHETSTERPPPEGQAWRRVGKEGWTRNGLAVPDCPLPLPLPSSAGVFRSCWNAILRIPGRDGKSTVEQFVTTARCRRRRDLKVDTYRVRVRSSYGTDVVYLYTCVYTNEIHAVDRRGGGGGIRPWQKGIGFH